MRSILALLILASVTRAAEPQVQRDLPYDGPDDQRQKLDVYAPADGAPADSQGHPIVFWIHGGGWQHGDKSEAKLKPQAMVDKGFVFVSTNYRFVPEATIQELAGDIAKAIRWTHEHAARFGGDPGKIVVMGHSAGAQLAALVCTDDRYLKAEGLSLSNIKGCIPVDGDTYDLPSHIAEVEERRANFFKRHFGDEQNQRALSSVTHVAKGKDIPPFLILHVAGHPETGSQSQSFAKTLEAAVVPVTLFAAEGKNHETLNDDMGPADDKPTQAVFEFLEGVFKK